ncbi:MAG: RHS repeat-associated core domain-containing protein [Acidobacteriota bacterium]
MRVGEAKSRLQHLIRARYYDAKTGRFTTEDPAGEASDVNMYGYVMNRPTSVTDPSGLKPYCVPKEDWRTTAKLRARHLLRTDIEQETQWSLLAVVPITPTIGQCLWHKFIIYVTAYAREVVQARWEACYRDCECYPKCWIYDRMVRRRALEIEQERTRHTLYTSTLGVLVPFYGWHCRVPES